MIRNARLVFLLFLAVSLGTWGVMPSIVWGQGGTGGGIPGGGVPGGGIPGGSVPGGTPGMGGGTGQLGGTGQPSTNFVPTAGSLNPNQGRQTARVQTGDGTFDSQANNVDIITSDDNRNQGFVGATAPGIQGFGFVGAASDSSGPPLVSGATYGGGVNNRSGGRTAGGRRGGLRQGFGGFGVAANQNGFQVYRQGVRARLQPRFSAPKVPEVIAASRFENRFYRLPISESFQGEVRVTIENRKATVRGQVRSQEDADCVIRQLRLEPGVYAIDNQLEVVQ